MAIKTGKAIVHVTEGGKMHSVISVTDEKHGIVDVRYADGRIEAVKAMNLFNSKSAANVVSANRRSLLPGSKVEFPQIFRNPK